MRRRLLGGIGVVCLALWFCPPAGANGFRLLEVQGAKAAAQTDAFCAQADDPSAIAFNPAGITQLEGRQVLGGLVFTKGWTTHTAAVGEEQTDMVNSAVIPFAFVTSPIGDQGWHLGLGMTAPYGQSTEWRQDSFARYAATYSSLVPVNCNPTVAYQLTPQLSIGAGTDYYYSPATLENRLDWGYLIGAPGTADGTLSLDGTGDGWGYNLGLLYKPSPRHTIGFSYRSVATIFFQDAHVELQEVPLWMGYGSTEITSRAHAKLDLPAIFCLGYAFHPVPKWKVEVDIDWTRWESMDFLSVMVEDARIGNILSRYDYNSTFAGHLGLEYCATDKITLRGGYTFNEQAVPDNTFTPSLPEAAQHHFGLGMGYKLSERMTLNAAYVFIHTLDREVENTISNPYGSVDGTYESDAHALILDLTFKF